MIRRIETSEMGTGKVLPTMIALGVPAAVAGVAQTLFDLVDTLFISRLGKDQISGVGLIGPIMFSCYAVAQAVNVGISVLLSRRLGEGHPDRAQQVLNHGLLISAVGGGLMTLVLLVGLDPMLRAMGADSSILRFSREYGSIIFIGMFFMHIGSAADGALRAQGNTVTPMRIGVTMNIANACLDWLFIFGLGMGVRGAAVATLMARGTMSVLMLSRLWFGTSAVRPGNFLGIPLRSRFRIIGEIYWMGLPASIGMAAMSLSMLFINRLLLTMNPYAVGMLTICWRIESFAFMPVFSLFSAVLPMVGYNLGAGLYRRCRQIIWTSAGLAAAVMGTLGGIVFAFPAFFFGIFSTDAELMDMGVRYLRIMMPVYPLIGASIMMSAGFQGLGKAWIAMLMHLWRNIIIKLPMAYWFASIWGVTGVWRSFPVSSLCTVGLALGAMHLVLRRLRKTTHAEPRTPPIAPQQAGE